MPRKKPPAPPKRKPSASRSRVSTGDLFDPAPGGHRIPEPATLPEQRQAELDAVVEETLSELAKSPPVAAPIGGESGPPSGAHDPGAAGGQGESGAHSWAADAGPHSGAADPGAAGGQPAASGGGHDAPPPPPPSRLAIPEPIPTDRDSIALSAFASRAYLDYAMSVLKGRALPDVADGQKPVQRRILYVMHELGLVPNAKPIKSARVVGDVLGKYHPHGDSAAYDAMVRMAQDFSLRYPLVDGHGNYGSRDGDAPAAYRYTEARLTAFANQVLLAEIDRGTVDFGANYDGAFREPALLPARLPVVLLNGASGIAVGMATEIPSHNLREVAQAAVAMIRAKGRKAPALEELLESMPGPDFPGGGQITSSASDIAEAYRTGRGSLRLRARWTFEELARGQWQAVITELPHGVSTARVLSEIEDVSNPKVRAGKKSISQEQQQQKGLLLSVVDRVRDESDKDHPVRIVIEPRTSKVDRDELTATLLALTSLETSWPVNLVLLGRDGRPRQKGLIAILEEWTDFRIATVERRSRHRLAEVDDRLHVLEGRLTVHLNVDKVIRTIREADDPKAALIARFALSDRQAEDILEMRLRQLARLESIRIEQEIKDLKAERKALQELLAHPPTLRRLVIRELEADAKKFGDARRTLIKEEGARSRLQTVVDEPVTLLVSGRGWVKTRVGHELDPATFGFKEGDTLRAWYEVRSTDHACVLSSDGRAYSIPVASLPGGKTDGAPAASLLELSAGARVAHVFAGPAAQRVLLATSTGYGFICTLGDLASRQRAGKQFMAVEPGEEVLAPAAVAEGATLVVGVTAAGKLHAFPLAEMRHLSGGGRGVQTLIPDPRDRIVGFAVASAGVVVSGTGRGGKMVELSLSVKDLREYTGHRARKGRQLAAKIKPTGVRSAR